MVNQKATERPFKKIPDVKVWEVYLEVEFPLIPLPIIEAMLNVSNVWTLINCFH